MITKNKLSIFKIFVFMILIFNFTYSSVDKKLDLRIKKGEEIVNFAKKHLGTPYRYGGIDLEKGVDCSGFVFSVFKNYGIDLNRVSRDMIKNGKDVAIENLKIGDILLFDTEGEKDSKITHAGIYINKQEFIHASASKKKVLISKFDTPYWKKSYVSGRRVIEN